MLKDHHRQVFAMMVAIDVTLGSLVFLALLLNPYLSGIERPLENPDPPMILFSVAACLAWPLLFLRADLYSSTRTMNIREAMARMFVSTVAVGMLLSSIAFSFSISLNPSFPFACSLLQMGALGVLRLLVLVPLRKARRSGRNFRNVLIIGTGPRAAEVYRTIESRKEWGLRVIGVVDDGDSIIDPSLFNAKFFNLDSMPDLLREQVVDRVIIAYPRSLLSRLSPVVSVCASAGIPFTMLADLFGDYLPPPRVTQFGSLEALEFAPVHHDSMRLGLKRAIDIVGASIGIFFASPVIALAALAIRLEDGKPIFFRQTRCGLNGRTFEMLKLRTMCVDAESRQAEVASLNESDGPVFKCRKDPRVTRVGRILRRASIDEVPQLWNVLRGDMSLVGPRPPLPNEVTEYRTFERRRLSMRPGITCIWQVSGRSNIGFERWVQLDLQYIDTWSLGLDLWILLKTVPAVLKGEGAS